MGISPQRRSDVARSVGWVYISTGGVARARGEAVSEQQMRPTRYCRRCGLELLHTGRGRLRVATPEQVASAPSFTLIGPRVLVTHCPRCQYSSVWAGREAAAGDIARAEGMAAAENARLPKDGV